MVALSCALVACGADAPQDSTVADPTPTFVGSDSCQDCHAGAFDGWLDSHHALAMQIASDASVLGDFSGVEYADNDVTARFFMRDGTHFVETDGADGEIREFPVSYTFGVEPLQQYLVELPRGKVQTLPFAWDTRSADEGGQRWFHIYPDETIDYLDPLHWTRREQNWNFMCAECHSTGLEKNYSADVDAYATTWHEINVGCEGCHGPASLHVAQAADGNFSSLAGFDLRLDDSGRAVWEMDTTTGIASRSEVRLRPPIQPEACGRCHARRGAITEDYEFGQPLTATHAPSLLDENLYFADGQILGEVYVYGSFLQSKMYRAGVSCTDCHDPHSATLKTGPEPNDICSTCHLPARFASPEHHHHAQESVGCVDCHMASRDYMVVDGRRDHSFRVPRPDLTIDTGSPNACNGCHDDQSPEWAAASIADWYGESRSPHYAHAIHAGRTGPGNASLLEGIANADFPGIARGTMLTLLRTPYSQEVALAIQRALVDAEPLVRLGALRALPGLQAELQVDWASALLTDPHLVNRIEAVRVISPIRDRLHIRYQNTFENVEREAIASLLANAERPEANIELGNLYAGAGDAGRAIAAFQMAMRLDPTAPGPRVNLADLYRRLDREADAEALLNESLAATPDDPALRHSLGLLLVRTDRQDDGLAALQQAASLAPDSARFAYVYAVALNSLGRSDEAVDFLYEVRDRFPGDFDLNWALATMLRDQGRTEESRAVATALAEGYPGVLPVRNLLDAL